MRPSVRCAFVAFTAKFEGVCAWMYLDVKGLVTTAIGNLIDPVSLALPLPFAHRDGTPAARDEIEVEWRAVKSLQRLSQCGGGVFANHTTLRLSPAVVERIVLAKLAQNESLLLRRFPSFGTWSADAQLGLLSMAWALGPAFRFPRFEAAVTALDFATASRECRMDETHNPGLHPRNVANAVLFANAAAALTGAQDRDALHYPAVLSSEGGEDSG